MIEIRIHGRGGQGGVTLAKILATVRFLSGDSVQAFGLYAAERSGAPLQAFCRYSPEPIANRNLIYEPDHVIVLDPTLIGPAISDGLAGGGWLLINSPEPPEAFAESFARYRLATVDATAVARRTKLGTRSVPIVNTALAGAACRMLDFGLEAAHAALEHLGFTGGNLDAASDAYHELRVHGAAVREEVSEERRTAAGRSPAAPRAPSFLDGFGGAVPSIHTGQWATQQPRRQRLVPPCNHVCPAGNDVRGFLQALARDATDEALEILLRTTPLPSVCGRVCPAPCIDNCNRAGLDDAVDVRRLERWTGDHGQVILTAAEPRDERVAVVGSGPAGLTAAYHLARLGYGVTVCEAGPEVGGLLRSGIPGYRLPAEVLDREIARIAGLGVEFVTGERIDRLRLFELTFSHDAVLVATGLQELRALRLGMADAEAVVQGIDFLDRARCGEVRADGDEVVVVGGGNTAIDAARSALRLGAASVRIVYRRTRHEMPAIRDEIEEGLEEGVTIDFLTQPVALEVASEGGLGKPFYRLRCRRMELGEPDASGRRSPREIAGSDFDLYCDRVILALGQSPDLTVFPEGTEVREEQNLLGLLEKPVFAIGDLASGDGTVAAAIGSGRRAALRVHHALSGEVAEIEAPAAGSPVDVERDQVVGAEDLRLHLFERQARQPALGLAPADRIASFDEIHQGLDDPGEARRCLSCGGCNECDLCVTYCPEGVLKRVGHDFVFDYEFCKGCGVCAAECPRNVVFMSHL